MSTSVPETETAKDKGQGESWLDECVGLAVVLLATFLGICNVKDDNICQKMTLKQADRNDSWAWFQARNIRQAVYESAAEELSVPFPNETAEITALRESKSKSFRDRAKSQEEKQKKQEADANKAAQDYLDLNDKDDQFDLCEASLSIGLAMMGITALIKRWWMFWASLIPSLFGLFMGVAGFLGWDTSSGLIRTFINFLS